MKKQITLLVLLISSIAFTQVGIGTPLPNESAQLDLVAADKGLLIPRVQLTSSDVYAPINGVETESLLVYNLGASNDLQVGFHYWDGIKWVRLSTGDDTFAETVTNLVDNGDGTVTYTNEDGVGQTIDIISLITANDTNTTNVSLTQDGTNLVLTDSDGNSVTVPLADIQGADTNTTNVSLTQDGTNLVLTDSDGNSVTVPLADIQGADTNTTNVSLTQDGTNLVLTDSDSNSVTVPLADIQAADTNTTNVSLTQDGTNLVLTDSDSNSVTVPLADIQGADTNTTNVSLTQDGTNLVLTDSDNNSVTVPLDEIGAAREPWFGTDDNAGATSNTENIYQLGNVGIGTATPNSSLEVAGDALDVNSLDGIIAPRFTGDELSTKTYTASQTAAVVYVTDAATAPAGQTINVTAPAYYYFDGTVWVQLASGTGFDTTDDAWIDNPTETRIELGTSSTGVPRAVSEQFYITDTGRMVLGDPVNADTFDTFVSMRRQTGRANFRLTASDNSGLFNITSHSNNASSVIRFFKARGVESAKSLVLQDDVLGQLDFWGYTDRPNSSEGMSLSAIYRVEVDGPTVLGANRVPTRFSWRTSNGSNFPSETMRLSSNGNLRLNFYPDTRNDIATTPINNLLYTDADGTVLSAPITALASGDTTTDIWVDNPTNARVELGANTADGSTRVAGTEFIAADNGLVAIGSTNLTGQLGVSTSGNTDVAGFFESNVVTNNDTFFRNYGIRSTANPVSNNASFSVDSNFAAFLEASPESSFGFIENTGIKIEANSAAQGAFNFGADITASPTGNYFDQNIGVIVRTSPDGNFASENVGIAAQNIPFTDVNQNIGIAVELAPEGNVVSGNLGIRVQNRPANGVTIGNSSGLNISMENVGNYNSSNVIYGLNQITEGSNPGLVKNYLQNNLGIGQPDAQTALHLGVASNTEAVRLSDGTDDVGLFTVDANPNTTLTGNAGSLALDYTNGTVYVNTDDATNWSRLATADAVDDTNDAWINNPNTAGINTTPNANGRVEIAFLSDGVTPRDDTTSQFYLRDDGRLIFGDVLSTGEDGGRDNSGFVNIRRNNGSANVKVSASNSDGNGGDSAILALENYAGDASGSNSNSSSTVRFFRGRGSDSADFSSQLSVQDGDILGGLQYWGYNNNTNRAAERFVFSAAMDVFVDGTVNDDQDNGVPAGFRWRSRGDNNRGINERMSLSSDGDFALRSYPNTRDDSATTNVENVLYTDASGNVLSAPASTFDADLRLVGTNNHITQDAGVGSNGTSTGTGTDNILIGAGVGNTITNSSNNQIIGTGAGASLTEGDDNTILGTNAGAALTTGQNNVILGRNAYASATDASNSVIIGENAGDVATQGNHVFIGQNAGTRQTTGVRNVFIGFDAGDNLVTGSNNTAIGARAKVGIGGQNNIAIGTGSGPQGTAPTVGTGSGNYTFGANTGLNLTSGNNNILMGTDTGQVITEGNSNMAIGTSSLLALTTGDDNIAIGDRSGANITTGNNNITLGEGQNVLDATADNQLNIGGTIYATNMNTPSSAVGIGTNNPQTKLHLDTPTNTEVVRLSDGTDDVGIFTVNNNPNGSVTGSRGSIAMDYTNGALYINTDDATSWNQLVIANPSAYFIGQDLGADGIVFHIETDAVGNQTRVLSANREESGTLLQWQNTAVATGATSSSNGVANSAVITDSPALDYVAGLGGDWYWPAVDELLLMFSNRLVINRAIEASTGTPIGISQFYWSSTEASAANAFRVNSATGGVFENSKTFSVSVRAIKEILP